MLRRESKLHNAPSLVLPAVPPLRESNSELFVKKTFTEPSDGCLKAFYASLDGWICVQTINPEQPRVVIDISSSKLSNISARRGEKRLTMSLNTVTNFVPIQKGILELGCANFHAWAIFIENCCCTFDTETRNENKVRVRVGCKWTTLCCLKVSKNGILSDFFKNAFWFWFWTEENGRRKRMNEESQHKRPGTCVYSLVEVSNCK